MFILSKGCVECVLALTCNDLCFMQDLAPGVTYWYRVQSGSNTSDLFRFTAMQEGQVGHREHTPFYISTQSLAIVCNNLHTNFLHIGQCMKIYTVFLLHTN